MIKAISTIAALSMMTVLTVACTKTETPPQEAPVKETTVAPESKVDVPVVEEGTVVPEDPNEETPKEDVPVKETV